MKYLNEQDINSFNIEWMELFQVIEESCFALDMKDFSQPIKPYLRYKDPKNRIIAMPAYLGGNTDTSGIKWIASFPDNIMNGIPRAHSTLILNEADSGAPIAIINSGKLSAIRTTAVTGTIIKKFLTKEKRNLIVGMTGFGPIGQTHLEMIASTFNDSIKELRIYDLKEVNLEKIPASILDRVVVVNSWQEAFDSVDIFLTCTVSKCPYINQAPQKGSLHLNVSLRDYEPSFLKHVHLMVVDDWDEVCRENTDVEAMHKKEGLTKEQTISMNQFLKIENIDNDAVTMFNPMGMAIFDIAIGKFFFQESIKNGIGVTLT